MQPPDFGEMLADRFMLVAQIVDEHRDAWLVLLQYPAQRLALAALVAVNRRIDTDCFQLRRAGSGAVIQEVGQDHHIGDTLQPVDGLDRAVDRLLLPHFGVEKSVE